MEIAARLIADAEVKTVNGDKQVVNFTVVINDYYKDKQGNRKEITTFFNCGYWRTTNVAPFLKKGITVSLYGRVGINVWKNSNDEAKGSLVFHVNEIKFIGGGKTSQNTSSAAATNEALVIPMNATDDLPF